MPCNHADFLGWCTKEIDDWTDDHGVCLVEDNKDACPCKQMEWYELKDEPKKVFGPSRNRKK